MFTVTPKLSVCHGSSGRTWAGNFSYTGILKKIPEMLNIIRNGHWFFTQDSCNSDCERWCPALRSKTIQKLSYNCWMLTNIFSHTKNQKSCELLLRITNPANMMSKVSFLTNLLGFLILRIFPTKNWEIYFNQSRNWKGLISAQLPTLKNSGKKPTSARKFWFILLIITQQKCRPKHVSLWSGMIFEFFEKILQKRVFEGMRGLGKRKFYNLGQAWWSAVLLVFFSE